MPSLPMRLARGLLYLEAVTFILFGVITLIRPSQNGQPLLPVIMASLFWIDSAAMLLCALLLARLPAIGYPLTLALLLANLVLTITDQLGLADFIVLAVFLLHLALLVTGRRAARPASQPV